MGSPPAPLDPALRRTLVLQGVLLFLAGIPTFVLAAETDEYFAWTIEPPLTAAFMGAGYWAAVPLALVAARSSTWVGARIAVAGPLLFSLLTLLATLLHFDRFHASRPITWAWVSIYVVVPALVLVFAARQLRSGSDGASRSRPTPAWARAVLVAQGAVLLPLGVVLFVAPASADALWPWPLSPLTGRIVAAWLVGVGVAAVHGAVEGDWRRLLPGAANYVAMGLLQLVALARYHDAFSFGFAGVLYVVFLLGLLAFGVVGVLAARPRAEGAPPAASTLSG